MKKLYLVLFHIILIISALGIIVGFGNTYTAKYDLSGYKNINIEDIKLKYEEKGIVKIVDKKIENNILKIKMKAISKGHTYITLSLGKNMETLFSIYVHNWDVITYNGYFGDATGARALPIAVFIIILSLFLNFIHLYRKSVKENMYRYRNVLYLGLVIIFAVMLVNQFNTAFLDKYYMGIASVVTDMIGLYTMFSRVMLPIAFITSILIIISSFVLIKREGFNINKLLGFILGVFICSATMVPELIYKLLYNASWIDIHNLNSIATYVVEYIDVLIYSVISYLEFILLATIILMIRVGRYKPKYDKDYIIILGCKVNKDKTLPPLLKGRVDKAIEFAKKQKEETGKDIIFIPSGGKGTDETISEAMAMKNYLLEKGISKDKIVIEDKSTNTYQNIKNSLSLIDKKDPNILFSTTNYHVFRAGNIASKLNIDIEGIGAKTKTYFYINAIIREYVATMVSEKKRHIIILLLIMITILILIVLFYFSNIG